MVEEMRRHIAVGRGEECSRNAPRGWIGSLRCDVGRDRRPQETPDFDTGAIPEMGVNTTSKKVELVTIRLIIGVEEATAAIIRSAARTLVVEDARQSSGLSNSSSYLTARRCVQCVLIRLLFMYAFEHINFT